MFNLKGSIFAKNVATLFSGKMLAALISLLLVPVVARLFEPAHFGVAAVFLAIIATLGPLSTACFDLAIVLPEKDSRATSLMSLSVGVLILFALLIYLILIGLHLTDQSLPFLDQIGIYAWLIPVALFLFGMISILDNWFTRKKSFKTIATSDVAQAATMPISRVILGFMYGSSVAALLSGYLLGLLVKVALMLKQVLFTPTLMIEPRKIHLNNLIAEYKDFPLYSAPTRFLRSLSKSLPVLMLGFMFSPAVAGFYAMADRLVRLPSDAAAGAVRRVYIQKASEYKNNNAPFLKFFFKVSLVLLLTGIIPFGMLSMFGEEIVSFILGSRWQEAGKYSEILAPWFYSIWLVMPSSALFMVYRKQKLFLNIQILLSILRLLVFILAYYLQMSVEQTLHGFVVISVSVNISVIYIVYRLIVTESDKIERA